MNTFNPSNPTQRLKADLAWLSRLALRLVQDPNLADDACQDAWLKASRRWKRSGPESQEPNRNALWLALQGVLMHARRTASRREHHEARAAKAEALPSTVDLLMVGQRQQILWRHVSELPEPFRSTLLLRFQHGLETADLAERQGLPKDTVRWRVRRGLTLLKKSLDRDDESPGLLGMVPVAVLALPPWNSAGTVATSTLLPSWILKAGAYAMIKLLAVGMGAALVLWMAWTSGAARSPSSLEPELAAIDAGDKPTESLSTTASEPRSRTQAELQSRSAPDLLNTESRKDQATLHGRVLDSLRNPQAGMLVRLENSGRNDSVQTDAQGRFEISSPFQTGYVAQLFIEPAPHFQKMELWFGSDEDCQWAAITVENLELGDLVLEDAAILQGQVVDTQGTPLSDVQVGEGSRIGMTNIGGAFRLGHLEPGDQSMPVQAQGYLTQHLEFSLTKHRTLDLGTIVMERGPSITGQVSDSSGSPLSLAEVEDDDGTKVVTGPDGHFSMTLPHTGYARLHASAEGFRTSPWINCEPGANVYLSLFPLGELCTLRVVDKETRKEIPNAVLSLFERSSSKLPATGAPLRRKLKTRITRDGTTLWEGIGIPKRDRYEVRAKGYFTRTGYLNDRALSKKGQVVRLKADALGVLTGRFLDGGAPVKETEIKLYPMPTSFAETLILGSDRATFSPNRARRFHTDRDGRFRIEHGFTGRARIVAFLPAGRVVQTAIVEVRREEDRDLGEFFAGDACSLWGRVSFEDGSPYADGRISLRSRPANEVITDRQGRYEITGLLAGEHRLWCLDTDQVDSKGNKSKPRAFRIVELAQGEQHEFDIVLKDSLKPRAISEVEVVVTVNGIPLDQELDCDFEGPHRVEEATGRESIQGSSRHFETKPGSGYRFWADLSESYDLGSVEFPDELTIAAGSQRIEIAYETAALTVHLPAGTVLEQESTALLYWNNGQGKARSPLARMSLPKELNAADPSQGLPVHFPHLPIQAQDLRLIVTPGDLEDAVYDRDLPQVSLKRNGQVVVRL